MIKIPESELILNKDGSIYHLNLHPRNIADTIITVGDPSRVHKISQHFTKIDFEMNRREFITHTGKYKGKNITVMSTGMGTDNIEILLTELDALVNVDLKNRVLKSNKKKLQIIRVGTSGALQQDIPVGTHLVSEYGLGLDTLMSFYPLEQTQQESEIVKSLQKYMDLPFTPYCVKGSTMLLDKVGDGLMRGNTVTCPGFYGPQGRRIRVDISYPKFIDRLCQFHQHDFWLTNFEMETAGYYAMARLLGHEIISVNAIIANRITKRFSKNPEKVIDSLIKKVLNRLVD